MHYVSTAERQIIKLSYKYISSYNLSTRVKAEGQLYKGMLLYLKWLSA